MESLQNDVKKDIISHPNGDIEVIYEAGKTTLTREDERLLEAYVKLNDFEVELKEMSGKLYKDSMALRQTLEELGEEFKLVKKSFSISCDLADKLSAPSFVFEETSLEKLEESREDTEDLLRKYNDNLHEVFTTTKDFHERLNQYDELNENGYDPLFDDYQEIAADHISNWQKNSINAGFFDKQFDQFREFISFKEKNRDVLISDCRNVMTEYSTLNLQTKALYDAWNEFIKRCDLLVAISDLHTKISGFAEN